MSEPSTQHYSAAGITSAAEEESFQAEEYDTWFNSDASEDTDAELSSYSLAEDPVVEQLMITNELLTYTLASLIVLYIIIIACCVIRFLRSIIKNIFI